MLTAYWALFAGNAAICWASHYALAGRLVELEADKPTYEAERRGLKRDIEHAEDACRRHRNAADTDINTQLRTLERMAQQIDAVEARVMQHLITPEERQQRMQAWMAEAEALGVDLSRIMKDLS